MAFVNIVHGVSLCQVYRITAYPHQIKLSPFPPFPLPPLHIPSTIREYILKGAWQCCFQVCKAILYWGVITQETEAIYSVVAVSWFNNNSTRRRRGGGRRRRRRRRKRRGRRRMTTFICIAHNIILQNALCSMLYALCSMRITMRTWTLLYSSHLWHFL